MIMLELAQMGKEFKLSQCILPVVIFLYRGTQSNGVFAERGDVRSPDAPGEVAGAGEQVGLACSPLTLLSFWMKVSVKPLGLWDCACTARVEPEKWVTPGCIECDLITFAYVNGKYDKLTVHCYQTSLRVLIWPKTHRTLIAITKH